MLDSTSSEILSYRLLSRPLELKLTELETDGEGTETRILSMLDS